MELIILVFSVWAVCKGIKSLTHAKPKASRTASRTATGNSSLNTLLALQTQRDNIKNTIAELTALLDVSETAAETIRYKNMISTQYGKLATVESKISKLIY
jgi:hypothetical protein